MQARALLQAQGIPAAVVSMPCWELFDIQPEKYRREVLGPSWPDCVRVAVEAAISPGWDRYIGENGVFVGLKGFGRSGRGDLLFKHFGITAENVLDQTKAALARRAEVRRPRDRRFGMDVVG
jgi:transketolase